MQLDPNLSRRSFLKKTSIASTAAMAFPAIMKGQGGAASPNSKLNLAIVGVGGRGRNAIEALVGETFVAFCDVDDKMAAEAYQNYPDVPRFRDYREMFATMGDKIDGVVISTPDHMHFPIAMTAIAHGKHVYVEKPLTHTVEEARLLTAAAKKAGVITQMGNQGHSNEGTRLLKEWIAAGVLGEVREVHSWTNRPIWPQGLPWPDHSKMLPVVPDTLDWNLWLGVAPERAYDPAYVPFAWRGWWDFGCGAFGDMACHIMDAAYWGLELTAPTAVEAFSAKMTEHACPVSSVVKFDFAARGNMPSVKWTWYDGGLTPTLPPEFEAGRQLPRDGSGSFIIGSEASVLSTTYNSSIRIFPETKMREIAPNLPPKTLPRVPTSNHHEAWAIAIREGYQPAANFDYAGPFSETVLLGNVAIRANRRIEWDAANMKIPNLPSAEQYLTKSYRPGFF
ncbi:Gfo/Idh/MocA family protein [Actomonas aquatica]|uniref:Gfo/Idh/MocA family oxidoreductase n=1 Tax=Actomonas aquatica TaxID=2866162 RepID=A0ABZ1CAU5_9BACT|nr:Gfo/Idh/MocA family oxidoreductase [Opitutus sp. WL0086]WRQ88432.1 Gfo/Idh/MocA family oxidoreductase [Opitutus sp. WL0086]